MLDWRAVAMRITVRDTPPVAKRRLANNQIRQTYAFDMPQYAHINMHRKDYELQAKIGPMTAESICTKLVDRVREMRRARSRGQPER